MTDDIVGQGVELMVYGMGTVVVFLALLVVITTMMSRLMTRYFPELPAPEPAPRKPVSAAPAEGEVVAAITAAIHQHRNKKS
ncbi:oxaloacetate decarboxylase [Halioglobus sp. HI00S01]|uniref:OadG family protein n=1 Tax=Halioglobus sp. HI00S01 TaxID=1822214 RepID=UPI0007C33C17|nr:OadG family protein [Halioglobus sp. HI00S01]KZX60588.1 oxaloacetate decarboxylase [Halioglobus sp. HI00S01]